MIAKLQEKRAPRTKGPIAFLGATLLTLPEAFFDGAVVVEKGRIVDVGKSAEIRRRWKERAKLIEAKGYVISPGLTNGHSHVAMTFFRDHSHGHPEMIEKYFFPAEGKLDAKLVEDLSYGALIAGLRAGTTCFFDHYYFSKGVGKAIERIGIKGMLGETVADLSGAFPSRSTWERARNDIEKWSFSSRLRPALAPHASDTVSAKLLREVGDYAEKMSLPIHLHLAQTKGERVRSEKIHRKGPIETVAEAGLLGPRTLAVHLVDANKNDLARLRDADVVVGLCPASQVLYERLAPLSEIFAQDFRTVIGCDAAAANDGTDLLSEAKITALFAVDRGVRDDEKLAKKIFASLTETAQDWAGGLGARRIAKGEAADLVFLRYDVENHPSHNLFVNFVYSLKSSQVEHVLVDGEWVLWRRELALASESELKGRYEKACAKIQKKAGLPQSVCKLETK